ncbi:MAG: hypothetical protein RL380_1732 [Verrucomicrobiota bacterium]|jgi:hypothetical protein
MQPSLHGAPSITQGELVVTLDGLPIEIPANRRSLTAIRAWLETTAMERQRVLCAFCVDGQPAQLPSSAAGFARVDAESVCLDEMPLQLLKTARQQISLAREHVQSAVAVVLINDGAQAQEYWWKLAQELREPLLTLALMPDQAGGYANGAASPAQLRKWQLQQLAAIIREVDSACDAHDTFALSTALENRALPWLEKLHALVALWQDTLTAGWRLAHAA